MTAPTKHSIFAERLKRAEIFVDLAPEDLLAIAEFCNELTYQDGQIVLSEDAPAETMLVVERGKLALEKRVQIGRHSTPRNANIGYVGPGQIAGFSVLAAPYTYSTSVVTVEPTRVIAINGKALREYLETHPAAGHKVMNVISSIIGGRYRNATSTLTYFLSIVSHELRSPLAAVENYLRTMLGGFAGDLTSKQERMVKRSILRVTDLNRLISDVVDLARMRPEQIQSDFELFDPGEVGTESIEDARLAAAEKNIRLKIEPPPEFFPIIGARRRLRQVFTNLLNNAIKFSPEDSTVTFSARYEDQEIIFAIEDQGPGIPEEEQPDIFKDFYRASNVEGTQGSGLGLSIAQNIINAHHGKITVENLHQNDEVSGTRFTVYIPRDLKTPEMRRREWQLNEGKKMEVEE